MKQHSHYLIQNEDSKSTGVYEIYFLDKPDRKYIGSAAQKQGIRTRWNAHLNRLIKGTHYNRFLQRTFNKKGIENIRFNILEKCDPAKCIEREQYWIDHHESSKKGFNSCPVAGSCLGVKHSEKTLKKQRIPILCYLKNGEFYKRFRSSKQASEELKISKYNVSKILRGKLSQYDGYIFKYYSPRYAKTIEPAIRKYPHYREIEVQNLTTGEVTIFHSFREIIRTGLSNTNFLNKVNTGIPVKKKKTKELYLINEKLCLKEVK